MDRSIRTISVLGCGWLGLPLAESLIREGFRVKGSSTYPEKLNMLKQKGIEPYLIEVTPGGVNGAPEFFHADLLIIDFPPRRVNNIAEVYPKQISHCLSQAIQGSTSFILFTSSTSVYPNVNREVTEEEKSLPDKASGKALLEAEHLLESQTAIQFCIIRFGGLIGADRNPLQSLLRKKIKIEGKSPVNLIHRDDCVGIILEIIRQNKWNEVFNACAPEHPSREAYYSRAAEVLGLSLPAMTDNKEPAYKLINSEKLVKSLNYQFKFPDPIFMY